MSWQALRWAIGTRAQSTDRLVLITLADIADVNGRAWPSVETIASAAGLSRRTVFASINRLENDGYLTRISEPGRSTTYALTCAECAPNVCK